MRTKESQRNKEYLERYNMKRCCFDFDKDLINQFKEACKQNEVSMAQVLTRAIKEYISTNT